MKLPEEKLEEIDRVVTALDIAMRGILVEHPEWVKFPHVLAGLMVVVSAGRVDILEQIAATLDPFVNEAARRALIEADLHHSRN